MASQNSRFKLLRRQRLRLDINRVDYVEPTNGWPVDPSKVVGRREVEESFLLHGLLDKSKSNCNQFAALGIVGTPGSGKTTICKRMFNSPEVKEHFLPRIWVCVTKQPGDDPEPKVAVAQRMLTCLGEDEKIEIIMKKREENPEKDILPELVSLLHRQLAGKRYLIVLDDVWDAHKWYDLGCAKENSSLDSADHRRSDLNGRIREPRDASLARSASDYSIQHKPNKGKSFTRVQSTDWSGSLGLGLPKGYGGAVIVNGRSDKVVERMVGKENLHHLLPLTDEDCWDIFTKAPGADINPQVEEELRRLVVRGAGGHPVLAELMGRSYGGKPRHDGGTAPPQPDDRERAPIVQDTEISPDNSSKGSSKAQVTGPEAAQFTAPQPADGGNGSSKAQVTRPESAQVTASQPADGGNGSSITQVIGPQAAQVTASEPVNSSTGPSTAQVTRPEAAQVTTPQPVNNSGGSATAQVIGPESAQVTTPQLAHSISGSSTAQVIGPEAAQVTAPQPVNHSSGSSTCQVSGPESAQVMAPQPITSSSSSSVAQVTRPESA